MSITDPDQVPATPIYTITVTKSGHADIDGQPIPTPGAGIAEARVAALEEIRIKAALHGRPVRVLAKEPNGAWPMIVDTDGTVQTLTAPHPTPAPPDAHQPAQTPIQRPATPAPLPADEFTVQLADEQLPPDETAAASDWPGLLPDPYQPLFTQAQAHDRAGDLRAAIITTHSLEQTLAKQYGPHHPLTIGALTYRSWITLRRNTDWNEITDLLIQTALRRQEANAQPEEDTKRCIRNAHAAWRHLRQEDPEYALEIANELVRVLGDDTRRTTDIIRWIESGAARYGAA
ncbi:hypothetical protein [Streptomyces malaysiensis]|uniref:hypothetical protein n=1 Tax=Streptomyces malaysiensis TaxID=92644 RepID=UPI00085371C6|nr:hypothetical protein [Streptomyces sp. SPMA113]